jgi:hypothetical protein
MPASQDKVLQKARLTVPEFESQTEFSQAGCRFTFVLTSCSELIGADSA